MRPERMLRSIERLRSPQMLMTMLSLGSGIGIVIFMFFNEWVLDLFSWVIPLPFAAGAIMLFIDNNRDDFWFSIRYFGLWAVVGLSLLPLTFMIYFWIQSAQHLVDKECGHGMPASDCRDASNVFTQQSLVILAFVSLVLGWSVPSLLSVTLELAYR